MRRSRWTRSIRPVLAVAVALLCCSTAVLAQELRLDLSLPPDQLEVEERLGFLEQRLEAVQPQARLWQYGWLGTYTLGLAVNLARAAATDDDDQRLASIVTAGKSTIGLANIIFHPLPGRRGADPIQAMPRGTPARDLARLEAAEKLLQESAERARRKHTPWPHLSNALVNLVAGGIILAFGEWQGAALSTGLGLVVGEVRIMTVPDRPLADLASYRGRFGGMASAVRDAGWYVAPRTDGGMTIGIRF